MIFKLPPAFADEAIRHELERACVAGGQDRMPYPTEAVVEAERLILSRNVQESGSAQVPWAIPGIGQLMASSATLMERSAPYQLAIELARGKINQVRNHAAEWTQGGLVIPEALSRQIHDATGCLAQALMALPDPGAAVHAEKSLRLAFQAGHDLALTYIDRVFELRHERQPKLDTWLGCRLETEEPAPASAVEYMRAFNAVALPFSWKRIEATPGRFNWETADRLTNWSASHGLKVVGGPLIDFAGRSLPDWLWEGATDLTGLGNQLAGFVENVVRRYQSRIRTWQITAGSNCAGTLACRDEELIWLTLRIADAVRRVNPQLEIIVGLAQPWGDYLAEQERSKTPFIFADDLLRTGIKLAALDLEFIMGVSPRGSYCRDLIETSRLLDLYALLGVPIQATLGYPSATPSNEMACPDQRVGLGHWRGGFFEETQADWASAFAAMALCKGCVRSVQWCHWSDADVHAFPNCGLVDGEGRVKSALKPLQKLKAVHLK
ncbi:MAG: endo-1,4-beta-xylanase [Planctomycetes bacterium]|nr:endo-1,4-beta-xylanase [Planctomycetota bacterium]